MDAEAERAAMDLSEKLQLQMSGEASDVVFAAIILLTADIAVNVAETPAVGAELIDSMASRAKEKMNRDWSEGKERLHSYLASLSETPQ